MDGYRILTIDDDPDICMILKTTLSLKYTVESASNGMEGINLLDSFAPDFIILDINMPIMNGFETAEAIRHHPKFSRVPIFFLSAEKGAEIPRKSYEVGGNLFLRKPLDPMRLLANIEYFLKQTGLQPGAHGVTPRPVAAEAIKVDAAGALRVLTVEEEAKIIERLKRLFGVKANGQGAVAGGPFETLWVTDPYKALGNLPRWEPDLILYDPRTPLVDGIAFCQYMALKKEAHGREVALIATRILEADIAYSENSLCRGVIDLNGDDPSVARKLGEATESARKLLRPKQLTIAQIENEESEQRREAQAAEARKKLEQKSLFDRFASIQQFIDSAGSQ